MHQPMGVICVKILKLGTGLLFEVEFGCRAFFCSTLLVVCSCVCSVLSSFVITLYRKDETGHLAGHLVVDAFPFII